MGALRARGLARLGHEVCLLVRAWIEFGIEVYVTVPLREPGFFDDHVTSRSNLYGQRDYRPGYSGPRQAAVIPRVLGCVLIYSRIRAHFGLRLTRRQIATIGRKRNPIDPA